MLIKIVIVGLLAFMIYNLFQALRMMNKADPDQPMSKFIGRRVMTSVVIVLLLLIGILTGLITPNPRPL